MEPKNESNATDAEGEEDAFDSFCKGRTEKMSCCGPMMRRMMSRCMEMMTKDEPAPAPETPATD